MYTSSVIRLVTNILKEELQEVKRYLHQIPKLFGNYLKSATGISLEGIL